MLNDVVIFFCVLALNGLTGAANEFVMLLRFLLETRETSLLVFQRPALQDAALWRDSSGDTKQQWEACMVWSG